MLALSSGIPTLAATADPEQGRLVDRFRPDQENVADISASWSACLLAPAGQEFVPERRNLDTVLLMLANSDSMSPYPAEVRVVIREGGIIGTIVATSLPATLRYGFWGVVHFGFASTVHLTPGETYAAEISVKEGGGNVGVGGGAGGYSRGRAIVGGEAIGEDLWFREGSSPDAHQQH
jgi:hypothetical protein